MSFNFLGRAVRLHSTQPLVSVSSTIFKSTPKISGATLKTVGVLSKQGLPTVPKPIQAVEQLEYLPAVQKLDEPTWDFKNLFAATVLLGVGATSAHCMMNDNEVEVGGMEDGTIDGS